MADLIVLSGRLEERAALGIGTERPTFYFDLACPFSYLAAERVERLLGEVDWVPVRGMRLPAFAALEAEQRAAQLRLPLVWPDPFPTPAPKAMRAAAYAGEHGAGSLFSLAAFRLAFCGGYDLEQPEVLGELADAVGISPEACLRAAADPARDSTFDAAARALGRRGVTRLPAFRVHGRFFEGEPALAGAAALHRSGRTLAHPA